MLAGLLACWCNFITSAPLLVQIVALLLHQIQVLAQVLGAVVAAAIGIFNGVGQVDLDRQWIKIKSARVLSENRARLARFQRTSRRGHCAQSYQTEGASVVMLPGQNNGYGQLAATPTLHGRGHSCCIPFSFPILPTLTTDVEPSRKKPADFFRKSIGILTTAVSVLISTQK